MNFFNKIKKKLTKKDTLNLNDLEDYFNNLGLNNENISNQSELSETIYFICLKHLSESMSKMPWEKRAFSVKKGREKENDDILDVLLNLRPNEYMSASTFWGTIELNKLHYGNAYVYIKMGLSGKPESLWILPSQEVQIWIDDAGIIDKSNANWYIWTDSRSNTKYKFRKDEILHFKTQMSFNGLAGMSIKEILKTQISTGKASIGFLNKLYKSNMFGSKVIVHYTGELEKNRELSIAKKLESFSSDQGAGKFIPIPFGMQAQLLDMKLADAQFFENNKISALQLAAAFGIKPNVINDYTKSSYSNSESQQIDFYVNTLQPLFINYQQELTYKLLPQFEIKKGVRLEINEKILFKMDNKTQAEVYGKYLMNFVMTPNEVREELNLPYIEGGDVLIGNGNAINLSGIGNQYLKGGEKKE
ncbi:MAG: phage portal protein [Fusobacteriaceae bacterium]